MSEGIFIQWEIITALGIPALVSSIGIIRYFWKKEKCFIAMKDKIDSLTKHDNSSNDLHNDLDERLSKVEQNQRDFESKLETQSGYLRLILDHLKIPYPKK